MKEISMELSNHNCGVCVTCGAIFKDLPNIASPCPECGATRWGLRYITPDHTWMSGCRLGHKLVGS